MDILTTPAAARREQIGGTHQFAIGLTVKDSNRWPSIGSAVLHSADSHLGQSDRLAMDQLSGTAQVHFPLETLSPDLGD